MTAPALTALIAKWRERSKAIAATHWDHQHDEAVVVDICADELETALAGIGEASASSPWRSMESAPRDGRCVIGFDPKLDRLDGMEFMRWKDGRWLDPETYTMKPTHWMPLPAPPVEV